MHKYNGLPKGVRAIPGRVRLSVLGLLHSPPAEQLIRERLRRRDGIQTADPCASTGRMLIHYDTAKLSLEQILQLCRELEQEIEQAGAVRRRLPNEWNGHSDEAAAASSAELKDDHHVHWHAITKQEIMELLQVHPKEGLNSDQLEWLRARFGPNRLVSRPPTPWRVTFAEQMREFTTVILLGASVLSIFTGGLVDGLTMGAVLILNAVIGTVQEQKAEKVVESLNQFQPPLTRIIRAGKEISVSGAELVPGDIVCFEPGDRVPADIRILEAWNLEADEATLTGESLPVSKISESLDEECPLTERRNMLYMGTSITRGAAAGIVVKTGMDTEIGNLMNLMKGGEKELTPLQRKVNSITKTFFKIAMLTGGVVFVTGLLRGVPLVQMITTSITLAASAIPQGLPVVITFALSAGIYRMAKKNALVRKLSALETMGRVHVICSDKTGTLTKNEMTVKAVATIDHSWTVGGQGYEPIGAIEEDSGEVAAATTFAEPDTELTDHREEFHGYPDLQQPGQPDLKRLLSIGLLCNNSKLDQEDDHWRVKGDPTEGALLTLAAKAGMNPVNMSHWVRHHEIPFDSGTGRMSVVCESGKADSGSDEDGDCFLLAKGSVEAILNSCTHYQQNGEVFPLSEEQKELILHQNEHYGAQALRVLGFAYRPVEWDASCKEVDEHGLVYVGMAGMIDPPKSEVRSSIEESYSLGVRPVMITGDHPTTAIAIAKQLGIGGEELKVLTGRDLEKMSDPELIVQVPEVSIFARVTPEHKLRIVHAFQKLGMVVAMTGDGVNDSPAIKRADVGIAMGRQGTEVTKETSDIILTEDQFESIVESVKEGRTIIGNIRRAIGCLLTGNLAEILVVSSAVLAGLPLPLVPIQILLMNLLTDALPATILGINPGNKRKLTRRLDIVDKPLYKKVVTRGFILGAGSLGLFAYTLAAGAPLAVAQTVAFATLVSGQLAQTFSWRQEGSRETALAWTKDKFFISALAVSWVTLFSVIYFPPLAGVFHTAPLSLQQWIPILAFAGSISFLAKPVLALLSAGKAGSQQASRAPAFVSG